MYTTGVSPLVVANVSDILLATVALRPGINLQALLTVPNLSPHRLRSSTTTLTTGAPSTLAPGSSPPTPPSTRTMPRSVPPLLSSLSLESLPPSNTHALPSSTLVGSSSDGYGSILGWCEIRHGHLRGKYLPLPRRPDHDLKCGISLGVLIANPQFVPWPHPLTQTVFENNKEGSGCKSASAIYSTVAVTLRVRSTYFIGNTSVRTLKSVQSDPAQSGTRLK